MNTNSVKLAAAVAAAATATLHAAVPEVSGVSMAQDDTRRVTISYTLSDAPAVVTLDVQTNATANATSDDPGWTSIGGEAVCNATGDVWKEVATGSRTITWRPDKSWPDHIITGNRARAVVTAWALDNTPDYMVVDISAAAQPDTQRYYPAADYLPGGILGNDDYRTTSLVMRKIMAKDVTWTMGSTSLETQRNAGREATHKVTLANNYYIGVFPVTQSQWSLVQTNYPSPSYFNNADCRAMRPVESVSYNEIRNSANAKADAAYNWPADPNPASFLGMLNEKTGLDFDLPSEAQWEFAARAGNGATKWGDGTGIQNKAHDTNLDRLARYKFTGGLVGSSYDPPSQDCTAENGTAVVGTYAPNAWGLYDTAGNVWEWCLDWFEADITSFNGKVNIDPSAPSKALSGTTKYNRVRRGGRYGTGADACRPAIRDYSTPDTRSQDYGFRVVCTAGLQ